MSEYCLQDLKGVLYFKDFPLLEFDIVNKRLNSCSSLGNDRYLPPEFQLLSGKTYESFNWFFGRRVIHDDFFLIDEYLEQLGLSSYDFTEVVKATSGYCDKDNYWLKIDGSIVSCYDDLQLKYNRNKE